MFVTLPLYLPEDQNPFESSERESKQTSSEKNTRNVISNKGVIISNMDDIQEGWLEDISIILTEAHISNDIDIVLGVVPYNLNHLIPNLQQWNTLNINTVEIAHHSYDHRNTYIGKSYNKQKELIEKGREIFLDIGIDPHTYIPPFNDADKTTLQILKEKNYHTFLEGSDIHVHLDNFVEFENSVWLCEQGIIGNNCVLKSNQKLISEIDEKIKSSGKEIISYHMQDFSTSENKLDTKKYNQFTNLLTELKASNKHQFMTAEEYNHLVLENRV